jgi:hypothetical protein
MLAFGLPCTSWTVRQVPFKRGLYKGGPQLKHYLTPLDYALWLTMIALQFAAWISSLSARLQRLHPRFVFYLAFLCAKSSLLIVISLARPYAWYYWSFYAGMGIETALLMAVVYEIFINTFDPLGVLPAWTMARLAATLITATAALIVIGYWRPAPASLPVNSLTALLRTIHHTIAFAAALALFSLVMYARALAIPWRSRTAGIAAGFLFLLSFEGFIRAGESFSPHASFMWLDRLLPVVAMITLAMWIRATRRPEDAAEDLPVPESLQTASKVAAEMRSTLAAIKVVAKTKWSVE